jgi:hypothetical protein
MNTSSLCTIKGTFKITTKENDVVVDVFEENNVVTTEGKTTILRCLTTPNTINKVIKNIKMGSDIGTGTLLNPTAATANYISANQTFVYDIPVEDIVFSYPTPTKMTILGNIDGAKVSLLYPTAPNVLMTSATIRTNDGSIIAAKRFPARTVSGVISLDISWTLEIL